MKNGEKPLTNPVVLLREEFDDWAVLFDPDTGRGFGLSPTGVYVWKSLHGKHAMDEMLKALRRDALGVPPEADDHLLAFVEELARQGLTGKGGADAHDERRRPPPCPVCVSDKVAHAAQFTYQPPQLVNLSGKHATGSMCQPTGSTACGNCFYGTNAEQCATGTYTKACSWNNPACALGCDPTPCGTGTWATPNCS